MLSRPTPLQASGPSLVSKHHLTLRRSDAIGISGLLMLLFGIWFFLLGHYLSPLWLSWIVAPTLWYFGGATTVIWVLWRVFGARQQ